MQSCHIDLITFHQMLIFLFMDVHDEGIELQLFFVVN